jgi:fibronectin type 3 domain-containing protein
MKIRRHALLLLILAALVLSDLSAQTGPVGLGMEPTPKNFDGSIRGASAKAGKTEIPKSVDLAPLFPAPGFQGEQNSCVAWATAYAAKSYQENRKRNWGVDGRDRVFSPSFIYNQINNGRDEGSTIPDALELVKNQGCATLETMPYGDYRTQPVPSARQEALNFRVESYARLDGKNGNAIKTVLADGHPVIIGMKTYENFMTYRSGIYSRASGAYLGGHAMVIAGYDDGKKAYKIMNSWGDRWGDKGFVWYDYDLFAEMHHTAMVMYDIPANTPEESYPPNTVSASAGAFADKVQVSWDGVKSADYYLVFRAEKTPEKFSPVAEVKGTVFLDTRARPKTDYFYAVKSVGPGGTSGFSTVARGYLKEEKELGIPRNLRGLLDKRTVKLIWDPVEGAEGYNVYRWDNEVKQFSLIGTSRNEGYLDAAVPEGTRQERYVVTAYSRKEESKAGEGLTVLLPAEVPPEPVPAPTAITASRGDYRDKIEVTWSTVPGAERYLLRKWSERGKTWVLLERTAGTSYTDRNVPERTALYSVIAVKNDRESEPSSIAEGRLATAPRKPEPRRYADDTYRDDFNTRAEKFFGDDKFFSDDSFFTGEAKFFDAFEEENFFFGSEEAFFKFDEEKFFGKEEDFFGGGEKDFFR